MESRQHQIAFASDRFGVTTSSSSMPTAADQKRIVQLGPRHSWFLDRRRQSWVWHCNDGSTALCRGIYSVNVETGAIQVLPRPNGNLDPQAVGNDQILYSRYISHGPDLNYTGSAARQLWIFDKRAEPAKNSETPASSTCGHKPRRRGFTTVTAAEPGPGSSLGKNIPARSPSRSAGPRTFTKSTPTEQQSDSPQLRRRPEPGSHRIRRQFNPGLQATATSSVMKPGGRTKANQYHRQHRRQGHRKRSTSSSPTN